MNFLKWISLLLMFWSVNCFAGIDGNLLLSKCSDMLKILDNNGYPTNSNTIIAQQQGANFSQCLGFVQGVSDAFAITKAFCPPTDIPYSQFIRITYKYLQENPKELNLPGAILTLSALSEAFPCPKPKSGTP